MRRLILLGVYLSILPIITFTLIGCLLFILHANKPSTIAEVPTTDQFRAIPIRSTASIYVPQETEARVEVLTLFFKRYNSPLEQYSKRIVQTADKYAIDWKLIPAIAMQESTLCKKIPKNSYNCWGFGIYGGKITKFDNYSEAIETVTKTLAKEYKEERGLAAPHEIVTRYTPGNTTWADKVSLVMDRIQSNL